MRGEAVCGCVVSFLNNSQTLCIIEFVCVVVRTSVFLCRLSLDIEPAQCSHKYKNRQKKTNRTQKTK